MRPVTAPDGADRVQRQCVNTLFGASFTSRLNQNIREKNGYSYGARSGFGEDAGQWMLTAGSSVQTKVTGPALTEFKREFDGLATGNVTADELEKAVRTVRFELENAGDTTGAAADLVADHAAQRPSRSTPCARTWPHVPGDRPGRGQRAGRVGALPLGATCWSCWSATRTRCCRSWPRPASRRRGSSTSTDSRCPRRGDTRGLRERPAPLWGRPFSFIASGLVAGALSAFPPPPSPGTARSAASSPPARLSCCPAAESSSELLAFRCVTVSSCSIALPIRPMPSACRSRHA